MSESAHRRLQGEDRQASIAVRSDTGDDALA
jgi:hypothetical protein